VPVFLPVSRKNANVAPPCVHRLYVATIWMSWRRQSGWRLGVAAGMIAALIDVRKRYF
jgi:hypothetical protein